MLFEYRYFGASTVASSSSASGLTFAPDVRRDPTFLRAELRQKLAFRECISALHDVVVSDLRFKPKDRTAYLAWRRQQDEVDWQQAVEARRETRAQLDAAALELKALEAKQRSRFGPFERARQQYFSWLYKKNVDAWFVLDPVVTVHPDEVSFECFSQDESSYGRLACSHEVFAHLGETAFGTTNVDYSQGLYDEFQKIRDYKTTSLVVDPGGFEVQTRGDGEAGEAFREVKIDLPDSWVRGFLQVGAAMTLPGAVRLRLEPMDVHNLCFHLRRRKEKKGPRSLRFLLEPGKPIRVRIEPFDTIVEFPRSVHTGPAAEIRVWGRRRMLTLERLVPVARSFDVVLLGSGMPSFWLADCGDLTYTLGLSGWTANDWSQSGNFDLLAARGAVDGTTLDAVWATLSDRWRATTTELSAAVGRDTGTVEAAMVQLAQAGRAMYDLRQGVWRKRELARDPLDLGTLRFANEREAAAAQLAYSKGLAVGARELGDGAVRLMGQVGKERASLVLDADRRIKEAECTCSFHFRNKLRQGPCEHLLALRLAHERRLGEVLATGVMDEPKAPPSATRAPAAGPPLPDNVRPFPGGTASAEAQRLADLLLTTGVLELERGGRPEFERDLTSLLKLDPRPAARGRALLTLFDSKPYVAEHYVGSVEELVELFGEWG